MCIAAVNAHSLRGLEQIEGGNGGDLLLGDDSPNSLLGADGDDRLVGRSGDNSLALGAGSNQARGDAGDDTIGALRADLLLERQRIACGPGRDQVDDMFRNDFAEDDCETIVIAEFHELQALLPPASWERPRLATYSTTPADCEAPRVASAWTRGSTIAQPASASAQKSAARPDDDNHPV
jgi:Ca2+-binding RTX toxin-like protein